MILVLSQSLIKSLHPTTQRNHNETYLLGRMLNKVGKEICQHVGCKGRSHGSNGKGRFSSRLTGTRRSGLEATEGAIEEGSRGSVEQHYVFRLEVKWIGMQK